MRPHLYKRLCPSVGPSAGWSAGPSLMLLSKSMKNALLRILNDLDSTGRGKKRDEEEGGMRREERAGRRDREEEGTRRVKKWKSCEKNENEKIAKGRIIGLTGPCYNLSATWSLWLDSWRSYSIWYPVMWKEKCLQKLAFSYLCQPQKTYFLASKEFCASNWHLRQGWEILTFDKRFIKNIID